MQNHNTTWIICVDTLCPEMSYYMSKWPDHVLPHQIEVTFVGE